jgi:galactose mutarotase-like enzyme
VSDPVAITSGAMTARVAPLGAELLSLTDATGREYMTDADPRWWTGHAPILFPIVGALNGSTYSLDGREYAMGKHGFARKSVFAVAESSPDRLRFVLEDSAETRAQYPFAFLLAIEHTVAGLTHTIAATVTNRDEQPMPFSFGFHPAFAWPLPGGAAKDAHRIVFERPEPEPIRRIDPPSGLLLPDPQPTPVVDDTLVPRPEMFEPDALIWDAPASRACTFGAPGGASVALAWDNLPMLGVWQSPHAHYLCIEPWQGIADPQGFAGDFRQKPGIVELAPGLSASFRLSITITPPPEHTP